jgi:hypothetical protein
MDYSPMNIAPKGQKQGDFFTTTIGPYDYWAIEYAYKPIDGLEEVELKKIAARAPEPDLVFATDGDLRVNDDPLVNMYDLGSDTCRFAKDRIALASQLMKDLDTKAVRDGESWFRTRHAFATLISQYGNAAHLAANYIGGQSVVRDHKGDKGGRDPIVPVPGAKQREALRFLVDQILSDKAFQFSPALLRHLGAQKWYHWGDRSESQSVDFPVLDRVLGIQRIVLSQCLSPSVLARLQNQELQADPATEPLKIAEIFRALTDGVWPDLDGETKDGKKTLALSSVRRNLQREYVKKLSTIVLGDARPSISDLFVFVSFGSTGTYPADAKALARMHLKEIEGRIQKGLDQKEVSVDDTTRAHLEEARQRIAKVLDARVDAREP